MLKKGSVFAVVWLLFVSGLCFAGGLNMKEGLWEITMKMKMPGMPMQIPPRIHTKCIRKEDMVPQKTEPGQDCKMIKRDVKGNTVTWLMQCQTEEGPTEFDGKVTYRGRTFDGVVMMKQADMEITNKMTGKWIGECN